LPDQVNTPIKTVEDLFKFLAWDTLVDGTLTYFGLNWWPLNVMVHVVTNRMYEGLRLLVDLQAIVILNEAHRKAYDDAAIKLKIIAHDRGIDSPEFKKAREDAKAAFAIFVQYNQ
jgi:hypothetical protein